MKKVLVIGSGGAGKTTFAKRLSKVLGIEVIHLDSLYWKPGWVETPKDLWKKIVKELLIKDSWIIDGNYSGTLDLRVEACDAVIFLDLSPLICLWRVFKRRMQYRNRSRPDMAEGCPEQFNLEFIRWVWNYRNRTRPKVIKMLRDYSSKKKSCGCDRMWMLKNFSRMSKTTLLGFLECRSQPRPTLSSCGFYREQTPEQPMM